MIDDPRDQEKEKRDIGAPSMDIQTERRRLLESEDGHDPTGLISEQDAYLRLVHIHVVALLQPTGDLNKHAI